MAVQHVAADVPLHTVEGSSAAVTVKYGAAASDELGPLDSSNNTRLVHTVLCAGFTTLW
jgi:hypothetical protein